MSGKLWCGMGEGLLDDDGLGNWEAAIDAWADPSTLAAVVGAPGDLVAAEQPMGHIAHDG